jgi:hypothetical protein
MKVLKVFYCTFIVLLCFKGWSKNTKNDNNMISINPISYALHQNGLLQFKSWVNNKNGILLGLQYGKPISEVSQTNIKYLRANNQEVNFSFPITATIKHSATKGIQIGWLLKAASGNSLLANHIHFACIFQQSINQSIWHKDVDAILDVNSNKYYTTQSFDFLIKGSKQSLLFKTSLSIKVLPMVALDFEINIGLNRSLYTYSMPYNYDNDWYMNEWANTINLTPENLLEYNKIYTWKAELPTTTFSKSQITNNFELKYKSNSIGFILAPQLTVGYLF